MTYFDAVAAGRFKQVHDRWVFYPWAQTAGYQIPRPEEHWSIHAWVVRCLKVWALIGVAGWLLIGPLIMIPAFLGFITWVRLRSRRVCRGYPTVLVPLKLTESYRARAEVLSWRSLWMQAAASFVAMCLAATVAVAMPGFFVSGSVVAMSFAISLAATGYMLYCKANLNQPTMARTE